MRDLVIDLSTHCGLSPIEDEEPLWHFLLQQDGELLCFELLRQQRHIASAELCGRRSKGWLNCRILSGAQICPLLKWQVKCLNREASDLGRLISEEARSIRRDVHRQLIETIERRGQQVWIPVTVATLVPGVIFLAIPFTEAMRLFTQS